MLKKSRFSTKISELDAAQFSQNDLHSARCTKKVSIVLKIHKSRQVGMHLGSIFSANHAADFISAETLLILV